MQTKRKLKLDSVSQPHEVEESKQYVVDNNLTCSIITYKKFCIVQEVGIKFNF